MRQKQMDPLIRFSSLVRRGLRFRNRFEQIKKEVSPPDFAWYPYDSFVNLFLFERLRRAAGLTLTELDGSSPLLDLGTADGALAFFFESLGFTVHACDHSGKHEPHAGYTACGGGPQLSRGDRGY